MITTESNLSAVTLSYLRGIMDEVVKQVVSECERTARQRLVSAISEWQARISKYATMEVAETTLVLRIKLNDIVFDDPDRDAVVRAIFGGKNG